ncbi:MAG: PEP-CTERM sorting domain-containing protein [Microcystaceae cyanobacterium]
MNLLIENLITPKMTLAVLSTVVLGITAQSASASTITNDSTAGTQYDITGQGEGLISSPGGFASSFQETYGEDNLIPYTGFGGGFAIVDTDITGNPLYFDKTLTITDFDVTPQTEPEPETSKSWVFNVQNTTPFAWSDYHFEFETGALTTLGITENEVLVAGSPATITIVGDTISLTDLTVGTTPGVDDILEVRIFTDFTSVNTNDTFGVRQIATTSTPEPSAILGLLAVSSIGALVGRQKG